MRWSRRTQKKVAGGGGGGIALILNRGTFGGGCWTWCLGHFTHKKKALPPSPLTTE